MDTANTERLFSMCQSLSVTAFHLHFLLSFTGEVVTILILILWSGRQGRVKKFAQYS